MLSKTFILGIVLSGFLAACGGTPTRLPHSIYYLKGEPEAAQVWRLEADSETSTQVTYEAAGVQEFDVSPADGSLAVVTDNQLFLMDADGGNRRLIADENDVQRQVDDPGFTTAVGSPVFSPDGRTLAYALDGLHLYDLATGVDDHVLLNLGHLLGETSVFARELYSPGPWSPDGSRLLIFMGYFEGSTLAVMNRKAAPPYVRLRSGGPVFGMVRWTPDGRSVLVANPAFTTDEPGLWRYDAETGEKTAILEGPQADGSRDYVGWPLALASGDLLFFHVNLHTFDPDVGIPLVMVRSHADGSGRTQVRPEVLDVYGVLWSEDGSSAIVNHRLDDVYQLVLARTDGSPLEVLIDSEEWIRDLAWGP